MDRSVAAEAFAKALFSIGVEQGLTSFFNSMARAGGKDRDQWELLQERYEQESEDGKKLFRFAVREAMVLAIFGVASHLDGDSGYVPIADRMGEFAVSLNVHRRWKGRMVEPPEETVEICPTRRGEDVHDIFLNLVDEWAERQGGDN